jgi:hypothetical protein
MSTHSSEKSEKRDIALEIKEILDENQIDDLKRFLDKRKCLNQSNSVLIYIFHLVQSAGILTTTIAAGYDIRYLIWLGVGLNILASLINVYEKLNNEILKKLLSDIKLIKNGTYIDESSLIDVDSKDSINNTETNKKNTPPSTPIPTSSTSIQNPINNRNQNLTIDIQNET